MLLGTPFGKPSHLLDVPGSELDLLSKKVEAFSSEVEISSKKVKFLSSGARTSEDEPTRKGNLKN